MITSDLTDGLLSHTPSPALGVTFFSLHPTGVASDYRCSYNSVKAMTSETDIQDSR